MKQSPISAASLDQNGQKIAPLNVVFITLDNHMNSAVDEAQAMLHHDLPNAKLKVFAATDWEDSDDALEACKSAVAQGDIIVASMLFIEDHVKAIEGALEARRHDCDALVCCMSSAEVMRNTSMGKFRMDEKQSGPIALLKKLRGRAQKDGAGGKTAGERQMAMLRRLPKLLKFIPGTAQDVRAYFLTLQYRLAASPENLANMVRMLTARYAPDKLISARPLAVKDPIEYPDTGLYHPMLEHKVTENLTTFPNKKLTKGTVGLLLLRSYILAGDTGHYDAVIKAFEKRGFNVVPAFCNGLDMRPAIDTFMRGGESGTKIDALVSLTGFSLVGGPAYSDADAAAEALESLNVPYISAHVTEFQSLEKWQASDRGLIPIETAIMVAIPELDGATGSIVFGGRSEKADSEGRKMRGQEERIHMLTGRVEKLIALRKTERANRKLAIALFNFPPNAGNTGTAAFLSVFESLFETLKTLKAEGYHVDMPESVDALRDMVLNGNREHYGALANVHEMISVDDHMARETYLEEIEAQWGPAPGRDNANGRNILLLGQAFGNVLVTAQPGFGYEGDPMRLLFEKGFAPTHAFSAYYRYLKEDFGAHAILHFGTHGALEFMPGKQVGMGESCWPDRLIGDLPNYYLYAANNPSEGTIAKRRSAATLVSYLTPPVVSAGLYKGLAELKASLERARGLAPDDRREHEQLMAVIASQAEALELTEPLKAEGDHEVIKALLAAVLELEYTLIPHGLHILGKSLDVEDRAHLLTLMADGADDAEAVLPHIEQIAAGDPIDNNLSEHPLALRLSEANRLLSENQELNALVEALDGQFVPPSPSGDIIRTPELLPTGRNIHGFDPFALPSAFAMRDGAQQAALILERHLSDSGALPETIAMVLWGTDNLKSEGGPMAQAMALMGAQPRHDSYGRVTGAELISLDELKRPRIDVLMTLSGIFRDLLPMQANMLAEASFLAATADEPAEQNYIRKHALAHAKEHHCSLEEAALRVFSNAESTYGSNVNYLISSSAWTEDDEIADTFTSRKSFAIDRKGRTAQQKDLLNSVLSHVDMAYQNLESVELGVTTIDHYFDSLGGITKAASKAKGDEIDVYISDQTHGDGKVRTLGEQINLETRTRALNPKWFEGMLSHGHEGVRQIEAQVTNTLGWSATTGDVQPWVYQQLSETFVADEDMRKRLADLNPHASARMVGRLLEASDRNFWEPDDAMLATLQEASDELEDRLEGIETGQEA